MFKVEPWCLMCSQNTVTYIAGLQTLAELGSTRGLGRTELISQESKSMVGELWLLLTPFAISDSRNRRPGKMHSSPEEARCIWKAIWECPYPLATALSF